ncbi:ABC transporter ATP-binding protein, partial [Pantoea dispersa]|uniref:ABC transporter transmembrane domain-containing protein n=1 Tax=Pantoea dispersa TaxID=59814 RepID=UPI001BAC6B4F|nr:ABC transporter ATP-binding protein [Pantoea dispersa]
MINKFKTFLLPFQMDVLREGIINCRLATVLFFCATLLSSICVVSGPFIFSYSIQQLNHLSTNMVFLYLFLFSLSVAAIRLLQDVKMILCNRIEQEVRFFTGKRFFDRIINANPDLFINYNPGKISALLQGLHQSNKIYIQLFLMVILGGALDITLSFILIGKYIDWLVSIFVAIYGIFVITLTLHSNKITTHHQKNAQDKFNESTNLLGNVITNIVSIKVFLGQNWATSLYEKYNYSSKNSWVKFYNVRLGYGVAQSVLLLIQYLMIFAIILWVNNTGRMVNQLVMVSMVLMQLNRPFEMIGSSLRDFIIARGMAEPTDTMLSNHCNKQDTPKQIITYKSDDNDLLSLELRDVSFRYSSSENRCLNNISAVFKPGKINFIMGPSG